jgi:GST-like protein
VTGEEAGKELRATTDAYAQRCWRMLEPHVRAGPWFLGSRLSALDLYLAVMTRWRPQRPWFALHCPKVHAVALSADEEPRLREVWARNFD